MPIKANADKRTLTQQMLAAAAAACDDKKGDDIRILALDPTESGLTDYFLICSGNSDRQNVAITDEIEIRLKHDFGTYPNSVEGRRQGEWILMDYVDFIVHVFSAEKRAFYRLESLRKTATSITVAELNDEIKAAIAATRKKATTTKLPSAIKAAPKGADLGKTTSGKTAAKASRKTVVKAEAKVVKQTATKASAPKKVAIAVTGKTAAKTKAAKGTKL